MEGLELRRRQIAERLVQAHVVEPADLLDDGELELGAVGQTRSAISSVFRLSTHAES